MDIGRDHVDLGCIQSPYCIMQVISSILCEVRAGISQGAYPLVFLINEDPRGVLSLSPLSSIPSQRGPASLEGVITVFQCSDRIQSPDSLRPKRPGHPLIHGDPLSGPCASAYGELWQARSLRLPVTPQPIPHRPILNCVGCMIFRSGENPQS